MKQRRLTPTQERALGLIIDLYVYQGCGPVLVRLGKRSVKIVKGRWMGDVCEREPEVQMPERTFNALMLAGRIRLAKELHTWTPNPGLKSEFARVEPVGGDS